MSVDPMRRLREIGHDLAGIPFSRFPKSLNKACFIVVNAYESYRRNLGTGPFLDAVSFAKCIRALDYEIYILGSPHARNFLLFLEKIVGVVNSHLVFFYVGQLNQNLAITNGEKSFVFDDGSVSESDFISVLNRAKKEYVKLTMVTDICPTGSLFDIKDGFVAGQPLPPNTTSIATVPSEMTAKLIKPLEIDDQGIFVYHLTKFFKTNPDANYHQLKTAMNKIIRDYGDELIVGATDLSLLEDQVFITE